MAAQDNLKVFAIAGRTASGAATAVDDVDQEELRLPLAALFAPGYTVNLLTQAANPNAFRVRQNSGSDMNVLVGSGTSKVDGYVLLGSVAGQGAYMIRLDATTKTVSVPAADATNPARYGVFAFIDDTAYSGTASRAYANVTCIRGTPAGSPVTPTALAAWSAYALLWEFQLPANATAVTNTILDAGTDRRVQSRAITASGGVVVAKSTTSDQAFSSATPADITFATASWTGVSGRLYEIHLAVQLLQTVSAGVQTVTIGTGASSFFGTTLYQDEPSTAVTVNNYGKTNHIAYHTGTGALSVHARLAVNVGTATVKGTAFKGWFIVKDIGFA